MRILKSLALTFVALPVLAFAAPGEGHGEGPCKQIAEACEKAGFIKGDWKKGDGLWRDCVDPIIQGKAAEGATKPLPTVDASLIAACKAKRPKFGEGKVGTPEAKTK